MAKRSKVVLTFQSLDEFAEFMAMPSKLSLSNVQIIGDKVTLNELVTALRSKKVRPGDPGPLLHSWSAKKRAKKRVKASRKKGRVKT